MFWFPLPARSLLKMYWEEPNIFWRLWKCGVLSWCVDALIWLVLRRSALSSIKSYCFFRLNMCPENVDTGLRLRFGGWSWLKFRTMFATFDTLTSERNADFHHDVQTYTHERLIKVYTEVVKHFSASRISSHLCVMRCVSNQLLRGFRNNDNCTRQNYTLKESVLAMF